MEQCEYYADLISASLDGALTPEEQTALDRHLETCPACRTLLEQLQGLEAELAELEAPPAALTDRIMAAVGETEQEIPFTDLPQNRRASGAAKKSLRAWWKPIRNWCALAACCQIRRGLATLLPRLGGSSSSSADTAEDVSAEEQQQSGATGDAFSDGTDVSADESDAESDANSESAIFAADDAWSGLTLNGAHYACTGATTAQLPEGFSLAGHLTASQAGDTDLTGTAYYTDSDNTEEIYLLLSDGSYELWRLAE